MTENPPLKQKIGVEIISEFLQNAPSEPGVYRMFGENDQILYVGKAKDLKKRIANYTHLDRLVTRIARMVTQTARMELTTTRTEAEALLLESNLIKSLKPRYNILLKDDKTFPYILLEDEHDFPRIAKHRGAKRKKGTYFGPFASANDVNEAIATLQKAFLLRPCSDSVLARSTRPCMEHQIKRCSAPCVNKISKEEYNKLVNEAKQSIEGKSQEVKQKLTTLMETSSEEMDYERAGTYRDRIRALSAIQEKQTINSKMVNNADIIALHQQGGDFAIQVVFIRGGQTLSNTSYFPYQTDGHESTDVLENFIARFYQTSPPPPAILLSHDLFAKAVLEEALCSLANHKVSISMPLKGEKREMVDSALLNAESALARKLQESRNETELLASVATLFNIPHTIKRIDVFDNSHISGKHAVGGMIVAGPEGFIKNAYRTFNVDSGEKVTGGDDFFMMEQVLTRRYQKLDPNAPDENTPDLILIDGGKGHLSVAKRVFDKLNLSIPFVCIAKGPDRNAGREDYHTVAKDSFKLPKDDPTGYYLQRLRDEVHRFAITTHRNKRQKNVIKSTLDDIPGVGSTRKRALLNHFGSARAVSEADVKSLLTVDNINKATAQIIYDFYH
jgi:excinuclease ABC subunit C